VTGVLLRNAELDGRIRADLRVSDGRVTDVAPALQRRPGEDVQDCQGGAVLPGLCDHHLHLHALAAWRESVPCGPPEVTDRAGLAAALAAATPDARGWIRGVGYTESVAGDLDAAALDRLRADDFLRDLPADDRPDLYRCATLRQASIPVALSSDAPYGCAPACRPTWSSCTRRWRTSPGSRILSGPCWSAGRSP